MDLSKTPGHSRRRWPAILAASGLALAGLAWSGGPVTAEAGAEEQKTYIVQMALDPVVTYDGGTAGLAGTRPERGEKIDPRSADVTRYVDHLRGRHDAALKKAGGGRKLYEYVYTYEGFAAKMTKAEAAKLRAMPDVVAVTEDRKVSVATSSTPSFLGLDARGGLWDRLGGPDGGRGAGEGLVIGVIDSGIWPDSRSFADPDGSGAAFGPVRGFKGACEGSDASWNSGLCNGKLISARHFDQAWGGDAAVKEYMPWEFLSPRDYNGHGTHVASTAAGDHGVRVTGRAAAFGEVSGIAPRARIAAYKALWSAQDASTANGFTSDLVAAIDQAVADGVDVINYSVSGTLTDFLDPVEMSFLAAAQAGVFVSAAGGNSGPAPSTVAHPSPWITTVAAGTHNRGARGTVSLGDGSARSGVSLAPEKAGPAPLVDAAAVALPGADTRLATLCYSAADNGGKAVLDPAKVKGRIVVCDRGDTPRAAKSAAVAEAGGVGMVLTNVDESSLNADLHAVPTVHLAVADRQAVKDYAATAGATATIEQAKLSDDVPAPYIAEFSSRGPLNAGGGDLLKPDVTAPGQDVLAAVAPPGSGGQDFNLYSGTSMAAPHVAGLAALLKDLHPDWSPMTVKSALMTTGADVLDGPSSDPKTIFGKGAGHVTPNAAADPGLAYDSDIRDWTAFLCATTRAVKAETCASLSRAGYSLDPSDMNVPSIAVGRLAGEQKVTRRVTNVGRSTATYTASTTGLDGIAAKVEPARLTLKAGETKRFTVTFTRATAPMNAYRGGRLVWKDRKHTVAVPVVVRPVPEKWAAAHGTANARDSGEFVALDPKGARMYVTGVSYDAVPGTLRPSMETVAYDAATGAELWNRGYRSDGGFDEVYGLTVSPDGSRVFITGVSAGKDTGNDAVTIAYDAASGQELWAARYDREGAGNEFGHAVAVSPDGRSVYMSGMVSYEPGKDDFVTVAYDAAKGTPVWTATYDGAGGDTDDARVVKVSPDGSTVFVTGQSSGPSGTGLTDWGTVAYEAGTGRRLWADQLNGTANRIDIPAAMEIAPDGRTLLVTGAAENTGTQTDATTVAYDASTGRRLWTDRYDGPAHASDNPHDVTFSPDGARAYVTGDTTGQDTGADYTTIAYDVATGRRAWTQRYDGKAGREDSAWDVAVSPDGSKVVVGGQSIDDETAGDDYVTIVYDASDGGRTWVGHYDGDVAATDTARGLAVDAAGGAGVRIFVTGASATGGTPPDQLDMDFVTVAYVEPWKRP
ncbi:S8 family serine peptidase [Streptosporangium sp. NPDC048047]|uniref:S8 family serine peptidase n=1 Tax=Streptosporangium sp. NPDC048047 TaxID=3155748 RepID=UPI0034354864